MKLPRRLLALTAAFLVVLALWAIGHATVAASPAGSQAQEKADLKTAPSPAKTAGGRPAIVQGKTIDEWLTALKDQDPAARERAVEVVGERTLDPAVSEEEKSRLRTAVASLLSDKNADVRQAAAVFTDLQRISRSPERLKRAFEQRKRAVKPTSMTIRLVDAQGRPVAGAIASTYFHRDADREPSFTPPSDSVEARTSDARGELVLKLGISGHLSAAGIYTQSAKMGNFPSSACRGFPARKFGTASR